MQENFQIICLACKVNVGQMGCYDCDQYYQFVYVGKFKQLQCKICQTQGLNYYRQMDEDIQKHEYCSNNDEKCYYSCQNCQSKFCPCVRHQEQKED